MKALERLSDSQLLPLALATNVPGPAQKLAPRFWSYLGDVVAVEVAHRKGMGDIDEPPFPELDSQELESGSLILIALAAGAADVELGASLREVAAGIAGILRDRLAAAGRSH